MSKCELLVTEEDGQVTAGTVTISNGKVTVQPKPGYEVLMQSALETKHIVNDKPVSLSDDSEAWFKALPSHYNGSRLRARIIG